MQFLITISLLSGMLVPLIAAKGQLLNISAYPVRCHGENSGLIKILIDSSLSENFTVQIIDSTNRVLQEFYSKNLPPYILNNLIAGKYVVKITTSSDSTEEQEVVIKSPEELKANKISIDSIDNDAPPRYILKANPSGGTPPYTYQWSKNTKNQADRLAKHLTEGTYICLINDANNCGPKEAAFLLYEPEIEKYRQNSTK